MRGEAATSTRSGRGRPSLASSALESAPNTSKLTAMLRLRLPTLPALRGPARASARSYSTSYSPSKSDLPWAVRLPLRARRTPLISPTAHQRHHLPPPRLSVPLPPHNYANPPQSTSPPPLALTRTRTSQSPAPSPASFLNRLESGGLSRRRRIRKTRPRLRRRFRRVRRTGQRGLPRPRWPPN